MTEEIEKTDEIREQLELAFLEEAENLPPDGYCVWYLAKMAEADALEVKVKEQYKKIINEINRRREGLQRYCGVEFRQRIDAMIEAGPRKKDGTLRKKSVNLLTGAAGYRASKDKIQINDERIAGQWARKNLTPGELERTFVVTERVNQTPLLEHFLLTGELPDGCEFIAAEDKFYPQCKGTVIPERCEGNE